MAASSIKTVEGLSYAEWAPRLQRYYRYLEDLQARPLRRRWYVEEVGQVRRSLDGRPDKLAVLRNAAGIIGAAVLANGYQQERGRHTS